MKGNFYAINFKNRAMDKLTTSPNTYRCTFLGLPSSGKTSFIGAFWHVVETGEIDSVYTVSLPPSDREYLNRLRKNFLDCEAPERTKTDFVEKIEIEIVERSTEKKVIFAFPDLSGETFESQFEYRKLTSDYDEQISKCNSIMLFVNPSKIKKSLSISAVNGMLEESDNEHTTANPLKASPTKWIPKMCQTQVVLVDLMQIIRKRVNSTCKIGVIISAWDIVKNSLDKEEANLNPQNWLRNNLPLFHQYLLANQDFFPSKVFGVSAQGGEYHESQNHTLQEKIRQSERIIIQSDNNISHDITVPLQWLFNENK